MDTGSARASDPPPRSLQESHAPAARVSSWSAGLLVPISGVPASRGAGRGEPPPTRILQVLKVEGFPECSRAR